MAKLTREDVLKLARLSKLELSEAEVKQFTKEIENILNYVEKLKNVDTTGLEPTSQVSGLTNAMRNDEILDYGVSRDDLLKNVPSTKNNQIKVKRVL